MNILSRSPLLSISSNIFFGTWICPRFEIFAGNSHPSFLMLILTGAGDTISSILRSTINQLSTPDELRGRMSSINSIFTSSGPQLGQFESGVVAAWLGAPLSALTGGIATSLALVIVAVTFPRVRQFRIPRFSDN
jgi:predicted MFS family arabinose efflux permease